MATELDLAISKACELIANTSTLVRVVLSGRRRNMVVPFERIDIRPVLIKDEIVCEVKK